MKGKSLSIHFPNFFFHALISSMNGMLMIFCDAQVRVQNLALEMTVMAAEGETGTGTENGREKENINML